MTALPTPLTKDRIWSFSSWVSSPISPSGGIVMMTSCVCSPVHRTRRKSALFSAVVAMSKWTMSVVAMGAACPAVRRVMPQVTHDWVDGGLASG
jgi:hypothetical protein